MIKNNHGKNILISIDLLVILIIKKKTQKTLYDKKSPYTPWICYFFSTHWSIPDFIKNFNCLMSYRKPQKITKSSALHYYSKQDPARDRILNLTT